MASAEEPVRFQLIVKKVEKPFSRDFADEFNWICASLGFFEEIDKDKTAASLFRELFQATEQRMPLTSSQLSERVGMSRGAVTNHLNRLLRAGLLAKHGRLYFTRSSSVCRTIEEVEDDILQVFRRMKEVARALDEEMGVAEQR